MSPGHRRPARPVLPFLALLVLSWTAPALSAPPPEALVATIESSINPVTAEYLSEAIGRAESDNAAILVLVLDTPGGLDSAMRRMVRDILKARVPVAVYVSPSGARAASAGVLITLAADVAAMAPGTNIGAAHPVGIGGGTMDNTMSRKVENDAAAYARSLALRKGRNAAWAESAVRSSESLTEREALDNNVVDLVASSLPDLLARADGRTVRKDAAATTLRLRGARIVPFPMGLRHRVLAALASPDIAYILLMIGIYGIFFELASPGAVFPGVVGGICLILGFFALQTLSASYAGLLLIFLALVLFILEAKVASYGLLTIGGALSMLLGSLMLFRSPVDPLLRVSWPVVLAMVGFSVLFFTFVVGLVVRSRMRRPMTGAEGLVGATGTARTAFEDGKGKVYVHGELWDARCAAPLVRDDEVAVVRREGMTLVVEPRRPS